MEIFFASMVLVAVCICGMGIGAIVSGKPLKGSCGGLNALEERDGKAYCDICGGNGSDKPYC